MHGGRKGKEERWEERRKEGKIYSWADERINVGETKN